MDPLIKNIMVLLSNHMKVGATLLDRARTKCEEGDFRSASHILALIPRDMEAKLSPIERYVGDKIKEGN